MIVPFEKIIDIANEKGNFFHVFSELGNGKRGYFASRKTEKDANSLAKTLKNAKIYNRNGKLLEDNY